MDRHYEYHPLAQRFPLMVGEEFDALRRDIKENGLREPIRLFQGKILDGRNRYNACVELGIQPTFVELEMSERDAATFSISANLQRRHLSKSQQAMYLVQWELSEQERPSDGRRRYRTGNLAIRRICQRYGISHVSIYKAIYVSSHDAELTKKVLEGEISVAKAEKIIRHRDREDEVVSGEVVHDALGTEVPVPLQPVFRVSSTLNAVIIQLTRASRRLERYPGGGVGVDAGIQDGIRAVIRKVQAIVAHSVCDKCKGRGCDHCGTKGWHSAFEWNKANRTS